MLAERRRFIGLLGATAVGSVILFWFAVAFLPMGFLPQEYPMWISRKAWIDDCQIPPIVVQGDSRPAAGLLPARIPGSINVAFGGATPVETFYVAQRILKCASAPQRVILSISPGLFVTSGWFWSRTALFGFLDYSQLEEIRKQSRRFDDTTFYDPPHVFDLDMAMKNALYAIDFPSYYMMYIINHLFVLRLQPNLAILKETRSALGRHSYGTNAGCSDIADDVDVKTFKPSPLLNFYMERLLDAYAARGTQVDFFAVPMNRTTFEHMNPNVLADFRAYLDGLAVKHANFHIIGEPVTAMDDMFFGDANHLNFRGAIEFSDRVTTTLMASQ